MGLERHRSCSHFLFQGRSMENTLRDNRSGVLILITSSYSYTRIFFRLHHQHNQVLSLREVGNRQPRADIRRYKKTMSSTLWLQLALLFCYLPHLLLASLAFRKTENKPSEVLVTPLITTITIVYFNFKPNNNNNNAIHYFVRISNNNI